MAIQVWTFPGPNGPLKYSLGLSFDDDLADYAQQVVDEAAAKEDPEEILPDRVTMLRKDVVGMWQNMREMEDRLTELVDDRHDSLRQKLHEMSQRLSDLAYGLEGESGPVGQPGVNGEDGTTYDEDGTTYVKYTIPRTSYIVEGVFEGSTRWLKTSKWHVGTVSTSFKKDADIFSCFSSACGALNDYRAKWRGEPDRNWRIVSA